jgi:hypothetical protein
MLWTGSRPLVSYISVNSLRLAARNSDSVYGPNPPGRKTGYREK